MSTKKFFSSLVRLKPVEANANEFSRLIRCLNTFDLTALGIGSTIGIGVYVISGHVSVQSGPSVVLAFLIAAIASIFAGLGYAEFGARAPKAGSAYVYIYVTVGEFMAFVIGWNLILEYVIGTAAIARAFSNYVDTVFDGAMEKFFREYLPIPTETVPYFDLFAFGLTILLALILSFGVKESTAFTAVLTAVNLYTISFVIFTGIFASDLKNWNLKDVPAGAGTGGFLPFGFKGLMAGAAKCFYCYVGFDAIATTGEEAIDPDRTIPRSIFFSLFFILASYLGVSTVTTLMVPYYLQNGRAPLSDIYVLVGWPSVRWLILIGAIASLTTALLGTLFPMPRVLFAMSSDGLLPSVFTICNAKKVPIVSTLVTGLFAGIVSGLFNTDELTDMMSIGTLLAYTLVIISVLILRYESDTHISAPINASRFNDYHTIEPSFNHDAQVPPEKKKSENLLQLCLNSDNRKISNSTTFRISCAYIAIICLLILGMDAILVFRGNEILNKNSYIISTIVVLLVLIAIFYSLLLRQPQTERQLPFKVPFVPFLPVLSVFFNFYLMFNLNDTTWMRFLIWLTLGLATYFIFGLRNSKGFLTEDEKATQPNRTSIAS